MITLLNKPIYIGKLKIKNKYVMPPMNTNFSDENGSVTAQMADYYVRRAKGGVGLIIVEAASIVPDIINHGVQPLLHEEKYIPAWANLVEKIKRYGAKVSIEIAHYGSEGMIGPKVSASDVSSISKNVKPLTIAQIDEIVEQFAEAVKNAKKAGFDTVTIHAAHGYLLAQFLSPLYNKREDEYGGALENRMRILLRIIDKCKAVVGESFPIMVRYSADEFIEGGRGIKESVSIAKMLEAAGVAALDISAGVPSSYGFCMPPNGMPGLYGFLVPYAKKIKRAVGIPVICVSGIRTPEQAEQIIKNEYADMVALGRTLIADPDFCNKAIGGNEESIRECLSCQYCLETLNSGRSLRCTVNAQAGREYEFKDITKAIKTKKVAVIGAGPAGMEAARVAALRGHVVTLYEKSAKLGGTMNAAAVPPNKEKIGALVEWYKKQLKDLGVYIKLNNEFDSLSAKKLKIDTLIMACGAQYAKFVKGCEKKNVMTATQALMNPEKVGNKIMIIGGGVSGCETAEYFMDDCTQIDILGVKDMTGTINYTAKAKKTQKRRDITIIEMMDDICMDMEPTSRPLMKIRLKESGVNIYTKTKAVCINDESVSVVDLNSGEESVIETDSVILSSGLVPKQIARYDEGCCETYLIGDCNHPGRISDAVYSGYYTAREI